jgi:hypothetical protein
LKFASGLDTIPYTMERLSSLGDITKRIELEVDDMPEEPQNTIGEIRFLSERTAEKISA